MEQLIDAPVKVRNEKPILFSGEMVKAILDGRKTQTRRIMKPQPEPIPADVPKMERYDGTGHWWASNRAGMMVSMFDAPCLCPHGYKRDQLWVKETFGRLGCSERPAPDRFDDACRCLDCQNCRNAVTYRASDPNAIDRGDVQKWKPSIFMPRWASRITLEITNVRVERLQDISEEDAKAEGIEQVADPFNEGGIYWRNYTYHLNTPRGDKTGGVICGFKDPRKSYRSLWDSINGLGSWEKSPWIWAITFKRV